jgi:hypothetical protein
MPASSPPERGRVARIPHDKHVGFGYRSLGARVVTVPGIRERPPIRTEVRNVVAAILQEDTIRFSGNFDILHRGFAATSTQRPLRQA